MIVYSWLLILIYCGLIIVFVVVWERMTFTPEKESNHPKINKISVLIPVRNESQNILNLLSDIEDQNYPKEYYEIIIINDHSSDDTEKKVMDYIKEKPNFSLINLLFEKDLTSHKKAAITKGIESATGDVIVTTDGDCRVGENWLLSINRAMEWQNAVCICGPVTYFDSKGFFNKIQILEFAALFGSGAATIEMGLPGMCNGANFSYRKESFHKVQGFAGIDQIASGDDELLMHKLLKEYPHKVRALKDKEAIVLTQGNENIHQLFNQRKRWASKWSYYKSPFVKLLAIFIFIFNLYLLTGWLFVAFELVYWKTYALQYMIKAFVEGVFIYRILNFLKKKIHLVYFLMLQIVYPFYTTFFGIVANFGSYTWKERKVIK